MDNHDTLTMAERRARGMLWCDNEENMKQQVYARGLCRDFNMTRPNEIEKRKQLLQKIFGSCGKDVWIEPPLTLAIGNTVTIGEGTYINSNLTLVDDYKITIGKHVLIGPNVTISCTNHPLHYKLRPQGQTYSKEVVIEDDVWISSNVVISAGVRIGRGSVIGAGSVVTRDIPEMTLAYGVPCKAVRKITDEDLHQFDE
jgi:galactoside O-acetyltransferase